MDRTAAGTSSPGDVEAFGKSGDLRTVVAAGRHAAGGDRDLPRPQRARRPVSLGRRSARRRGLAAYALDLRGRGKSDGERYFVEHVDDGCDDLGGLSASPSRASPDLPLFLLGHSAGGVISCIYSLEHQSELAGFICESFAFQVSAPDFALA